MANKKAALSEEVVTALVQRYLSGATLTTADKNVLKQVMQANPAIAQYVVQQKNAATQKTAIPQNAQRKQLNQVLANKNAALGNRYSPKSPGGFKKSGLDLDSQVRESGAITASQQRDADPRRAMIFSDGTAIVNGRKYTKREVQAVLNRGKSGASLGGNDQKIFDRYVGIVNARQQQAADARQQEMIAQAERRQQIEAMGIDPDGAQGQELAAMKNFDFNKFVADDTAEKMARQQRFADEANAVKARRERLEKGADGLKKLPDGYSYTKEQKEAYNNLSQELSKLSHNKDISDKDKDKIREQYLQEMENIRNNPVMALEPEETSQQSFDKGIVTFTDDNGRKIKGTVDKSGTFHPIANFEDKETKEKEKLARDAAAAKQRRDDAKRANIEKRAREIYDRSRFVSNQTDVDEGKASPQYSYSMEYRDAVKKAREEYDEYDKNENSTQSPIASELPFDESRYQDYGRQQQDVIAAQNGRDYSTENSNITTANANDWRSRRARQTGAAIGNSNTEAANETSQSTIGEPVQNGGYCPVCHENAVVDGVCQVCGWREGDPIPGQVDTEA